MQDAHSPRHPIPALPLLAIDSSGAACSVALVRGSEIRAARSARMARGHAEALMPMVGEVLAEAGTRYREIGCFAVTVGPGSFTGLRTGIAAARGLALALSRPVIGVTAFEAVARVALRAVAGDGTDCLVVLDTRRADLYAQRFAPDGAALTGPLAMMPEPLVSSLGAGPLLLAGDAAASVRPLLEARGIDCWGPTGEGVADAAAVAEIAAERWRAPPAEGLEPPRPLYLRPPDAIRPPGGGRLRP
ncbi:MAG: tRNA (adenosine(37)-N6)-threonylcarbamoyltransferase complex dimerization subunit type 1 TsaB [Defluviicoccus sp.]|nr:tRNA (adenosine(37)-N6)-threonylcarbamoyltransferase complex dimerization subunit type 1 TsaB [Defluviicoccus sp.]MDE0386629.1 tRNA (adenosine(37)-N6)-threonylcarbamoyltransferase complex dimerization subunit type 1 TsaB [Defluviicoccus sp.]